MEQDILTGRESTNNTAKSLRHLTVMGNTNVSKIWKKLISEENYMVVLPKLFAYHYHDVFYFEPYFASMKTRWILHILKDDENKYEYKLLSNSSLYFQKSLKDILQIL